MEVVDTVEDYATQIALVTARERNPDAQLGDFIMNNFRRWFRPASPPVGKSGSSSEGARMSTTASMTLIQGSRRRSRRRRGQAGVEYGNVVDLGRGETSSAVTS